MTNGWICLHRKILDWEWFSDAYTLKVFIICLMLANHEDKRWQGQVIKRGQFVTSLEHLSIMAKVTVQRLRTCLKRLESTGEIVKKSTSKNTIITICKYDDYQDKELDNQQTNNKQSTNNQQTINKQTTTNNNDNNINNDNNNNNILCPNLQTDLFGQEVKTVEPLNIDKIVSLWNENFKNTKVPCVMRINDSRRNKIKSRFNEVGYDNILKAITIAGESSFLKTQSGNWFTFDWLFVNDKNIEKVLEGNYNDKEKSPTLVSASADGIKLDENLVKMLQAQYTIEGDDGKMYASFNDYKNHTNSLDERLAREIERKKEMIQQEQIQ